MAKKIKCVLQASKFSTVDSNGKRTSVERGDVVELTPAQLEAFYDKFEELSVVEAKAEVAKKAAAKAKAESDEADKEAKEKAAKEAKEKAEADKGKEGSKPPAPGAKGTAN